LTPQRATVPRVAEGGPTGTGAPPSAAKGLERKGVVGSSDGCGRWSDAPTDAFPAHAGGADLGQVPEAGRICGFRQMRPAI
jgi:hypothetical protein